MAQKNIFRASALAKIQSPDQLDSLLPITSPAHWLALLILGAGLLGLLAWGIFGSVMRTGTGQGIIVRDSDSGIQEISGIGQGSVYELYVKAGDEVQAGQAVAKLSQSLARAELDNLKVTLERLRTQDSLRSTDEEDRLHALTEKALNQQKLYEEGLLTKSALLETKASIYDINSRAFTRRQEILQQDSRIRQAEMKLSFEEIVRAAHPGRITEILVDIGEYVSTGKPLARTESLKGEYDVIAYLPASEGKKARPGMSIRVAPGHVRPEEYGYILGMVEKVSFYPVTREGVIRELHNDKLVDSLLSSGAAIELTARLFKDPRTPSGFRWSSSHGPDQRIEGGTVCSTSVVLERQRPITLVIPFLKKLFGVE